MHTAHHSHKQLNRPCPPYPIIIANKYEKVATTDSVELISLSVGVPDESISFCGADMKALVWIRVCGVVSSTGSGIIVPFSIICAVLDVSSIRSGVTKGTVESAADLAV
ncbi:hypothetical protein BLNAU_18113 [Blattamonas nauphoetae]|uniref:Uncharacterized protein n=1 Tax=Blattamonas nauphoetae TaxID=2049346 RepID=A0ABQ9WZK2_9EUKA|nr:hypothetical protein BLNAU_20354 [Blattamonas nauphoetae]KAK2946955.1 hypothetical protein BLNAU_18113 [Blattamonas nauphoetae]